MMKKTKDYKSEYAQKLVAWFRDAPLFVEETKEVFSKKSDKIETIINKTLIEKDIDVYVYDFK